MAVHRSTGIQYADLDRPCKRRRSYCKGDVRVIGEYSIIYADPPWQYRQTKVNGAAEKHYPTMSLDAIMALPVQELAGKDCTLFLWVTSPMLFEAQKVIKAWGFDYKTVAFVWIKRNRKANSLFWGLGSWTRANAELCLLATKGHPKRIARNVHQVIISPLERHSKKPEEARNRIVELMGDLPRIELFAREAVPGWDVWGNEVESDIEMCPTVGRIST